MRFKVTLSFDVEHPLSLGQPWPDLAESIIGQIRENPAAYLDLALPPISSKPGTHQRSAIGITIKPV